jgi:hypothetical protein
MPPIYACTGRSDLTLKKEEMKKIILITVAILVAGISVSYGQDSDAKVKKPRQDQSELYNNFYLSYGLGSVFYFIDHEGASADYTTGTFQLGFSRSFNKVIAVGFVVSYTNIGRTDQNYYYPDQTVNNEVTDNLWQGIATVRFQYLNRSSFCMYSGIGIGVTMDNYTNKNVGSGSTTKGQNLYPAVQLTLLGFRVGHALSFFGEFGVGTNSIINAGVSYKFGDNL